MTASPHGMGTPVFDAAGAPQRATILTGIDPRLAPGRRGGLGRLLVRAADELCQAAQGARSRLGARD